MILAHGTNNIRGNLKSLQILRAVAATSVVYYHIGTIPVFGSFGVDIFFVISGFVMAMVIANGQSAYTFAVSRLTRIIPLYWVLTTCVLLLAAIKPDLFNSTTANLTNYLKSIFFIPYFKENGTLTPMLNVGWTLNYEMLFYFCIWLSVVIKKEHYVFLTLFLLMAARIGIGQNSEDQVLKAFFGSNLILEFVLGIFTFEIYRRNWLACIAGYLWFFVALISYASMAFAETYEMVFDRVYLYGIPSVLLVLALTYLENTVFREDNRLIGLITTLGDGSYATYLSHVFVVEGTKKIAFEKLGIINPYTPLGVFIVIASALLVGHLIYTHLDEPLRRHFKNRFLSCN
jgi:peptidoglycan/LPS O-acetylase OafA/YrhL